MIHLLYKPIIALLTDYIVQKIGVILSATLYTHLKKITWSLKNYIIWGSIFQVFNMQDFSYILNSLLLTVQTAVTSQYLVVKWESFYVLLEKICKFWHFLQIATLLVPVEGYNQL